VARHFQESEKNVVSFMEEYIGAGELSFRINMTGGYLERYQPDVVNGLIQDVIR